MFINVVPGSVRKPNRPQREENIMSALPEREYLAEEICDLYTRLTGGDYSEDLRRARELAEDEGPQDHWLLTNHLDYESRLFLYAAVAYSLRCMKRDPYKCAVFARSAAESLTAARSAV